MTAPLPPLPPVLYWSAQLAQHLNDRFGVHLRHGLIDATVPTMLLTCGENGCWEAGLDGRPADAVRLVAEIPSSKVHTEFRVRWPGDTDSEDNNGGRLMQRTAVYGPWVETEPARDVS